MVELMESRQDRRTVEGPDAPDQDRKGAHLVSGVESTATIAGHPIHPMLIAYPLAFLSTTIVTDIAYRRTRDPFWARASAWLLRAGLASGAAAGVFGATDFLTTGRARHATGQVHAIGNAAVLTLALANLRQRRGNPARGVGATGLALSAATAALLGITGWAGGELSYRHGIGVVGEEGRGNKAQRARAGGARAGGAKAGFRR